MAVSLVPQTSSVSLIEKTPSIDKTLSSIDKGAISFDPIGFNGSGAKVKKRFADIVRAAHANIESHTKKGASSLSSVVTQITDLSKSKANLAGKTLTNKLNALYGSFVGIGILLANDLSIINKIKCEQDTSHTNTAEKVADFLLTPARVFFGRTYQLEKKPDELKRFNIVSHIVLTSPEEPASFVNVMIKIASIVLLPLSLLAVAFGALIKVIDLAVHEKLKDKYKLTTIVNSRNLADMTSGKLPRNPLTMNCVNSQQKSCWGKLYDAEPISAKKISEPVKKMKEMLLKDKQYRLVEATSNYLHFTHRVEITSGLLKGVYIDDVDLSYDAQKEHFDIRSASRTGFRDSLDIDIRKPGANKKRIESIRSEFAKVQ